ncbi:MAG: hypothetical protein IPM34_11490 [Saprospiraceae bacterium]|nr:hypothetical protein [Saprospiraceae bacterium]
MHYFSDACEFVKNIPYGRNKNKFEFLSVFTENSGTCSTKHALLKQLSTENGEDAVKLILGVYKMSKENTGEVGKVLMEFKLNYIPEAHNYLKIGGNIVDCTNPYFSTQNYAEDILLEIEIEPYQITEFKVNFHKNFLKQWLLTTPDIPYNPEELWIIREKCILSLAST